MGWELVNCAQEELSEDRLVVFLAVKRSGWNCGKVGIVVGGLI